jgi:hypothetical protein
MRMRMTNAYNCVPTIKVKIFVSLIIPYIKALSPDNIDREERIYII